MKDAINVVDKALDKYVRQMRTTKSIDPTGVQAKTLAAYAGVTGAEMSIALQQYRYAQQVPGSTKYVIGSESYGRAARWTIQSKPGSDPIKVQKARAKHAKYVARDNLTKLVRDYAMETHPGLQGTQLDQIIELSVAGLEAQVTVVVDTAVALIEVGQANAKLTP